jgi:hypothetical protein
MSSQPSTPAPSISKSAAKKRAKKAAASARTLQPQVTATATAEVRVDLGDAIDPNEQGIYLPAGNYPVDLEYEHEQFYDDTEFAPGGHHQSIPLPFLDYSLSPYQQQAHPFTNLPPSVNITNEDLIQTANELYRRMADPKFASDDAYWSSLPAHIRNFIREAVPFAPGDAQANGTAGRDESIHSLAQRIVTVASQGMGLNNVGAGLMNGDGQSYRSTQPPPPPPQQPGLARKLGFHPHPDAREEDEYDDDDLDQETELSMAAANGDAPKKKNKKKKKKAANTSDAVLSPVAQPPMPPIKQTPTTQPPHPQQPTSRPTFHPPPPPTTAPNGSTPSPRAIGKQPMATNNHASTPPSRTAKGKAPATSNGTAHPSTHNHPPANKSAPAKGKAPANTPPAKIWTQSSAKDREHMAAFWLGLTDAERRDLVQIEKDAVVKKMKEQHRHACGCAVCGRKKVNIEMELDSLYEQYYEELLVYAANQQAAAHGRQPAPPGAGPFPGSVEVDASGQVVKFDHRAPERHLEEDEEGVSGDEVDDEDGEDEYEDEEGEEDGQSDEADMGDEVDEQPPPRQARKAPVKSVEPRPEGEGDFLAFGAGLTTIKGGSFSH